ncbi:MAG TPA: PP2C family protein-serine/threonine phosphatase, partial [Spirochaetota bacterium]
TNDTISKCVNTNPMIIDAMENVERTLGLLLERESGRMFEDFLVFHHGKFFGVGSFLKVTSHVSLLRSMDLSKARDVQDFLIKKRSSSDNGFSIRTYIRMAHALGGDFFQAMKLSDTLSVIACFDVSGKNVSAALTTSMLGAFFATMDLGGFMRDKTPAEFVRMCNQVCCDQTPGGTYVTGVFLFVDRSRNMLEIYNCGHTQVYQFSSDDAGKRSCTIISPSMIPLGIDQIENIDSAVRTVKITPGLRLFVYTDGLVDAQNLFGKKYGDEGLKKYILSTYRYTLDELMTSLAEEISGFVGDAVLADDITAAAIQFD